MRSGTLTIATKRKITGFVCVLPCIVVLLLMMAYPVLQTFLFSFSKIELPSFKLSFNGFNNFISAFSKPDVQLIIRNTIAWTIGSTVLRLSLGLVCALIMNADVPGISVLRIIALLPWTVPLIVSSNSWRWMLQSDYGVINGMLKLMGLNGFALNWLASSSTALPAVLTAATWAGYPFVMMMLLSAMQSLPVELYEAARIDGANRFQLFRFITLPGIKPVLFVVLTLELINAVNAFDMLFVMTGGGPGGATEILGLFVYRLAFVNFDFGEASSVSVVLIALVILGFVLYNTALSRSKHKGEAA
ncbi:MAG: sugar ABC transporter permease [Treponemataceae bacterium]